MSDRPTELRGRLLSTTRTLSRDAFNSCRIVGHPQTAASATGLMPEVTLRASNLVPLSSLPLPHQSRIPNTVGGCDHDEVDER